MNYDQSSDIYEKYNVLSVIKFMKEVTYKSSNEAITIVV